MKLSPRTRCSPRPCGEGLGVAPGASAPPTIAIRRGAEPRARFRRRHSLCRRRPLRKLRGARRDRAAGGARARPGHASCSTATFTGSTPSRTGSPRSSAASRGISAIRGNVETEIARASDIGAGCGCAYPDDVDEGIVTRSNEILDRSARGRARPRPRSASPRCRCISSRTVGGLRVGIVHGDAASLAGWRFAHDALDDPANDAWLAEVRASRGVDVFASTHTCLAALREFALPDGRLTVINNGAAGMANFSGTTLRADLAHRDRALARIRRSTASRATACSSTRWRSSTTSRHFSPASRNAGRKARPRTPPIISASSRGPAYRVEQAKGRARLIA